MEIKKTIKSILPAPIYELLKEQKRRHKSAQYYLKYEKNYPGEYYSLHAYDYYKCIFVHIPKTAGLSINMSLFGNFGASHLTIRDYKKKYHPYTFKRYFKFTFVRNPWDRIYSAFVFLKQGGINEFDKNFSEKHLKNIKSFEDFVLNWLNEETIFSYIHFYPQMYFITDEKDRIPLDFIGRFENLENDIRIVARKLGIKNFKLEHINRTPNRKKDFRQVYNDKMIEKIYMLYKSDVERLNYNFDK